MHIDMPLSEAKSLVWRGANKNQKPANGPPFHILPHDPAADLYAIEKLADELDEFSPIIGLPSNHSQPDCIFLDVTGLSLLFGNEFNLAKGVSNFCHQQGFVTQVAVADTVGQAQGFAQNPISGKALASSVNECQTTEQNPNLQQAPSSQEIPYATISIPDSPNAFHSLPVTALRLESWITETLYQLGIRTVGQLIGLPRQDLSARFGNQIHTRIDQLMGNTVEPIVAKQSQPEFYAEQLLDYPTSHKETIEVILQRLIEKICKRMKSVQQGALQWTIRLYCQDNKLPLKLYVSLFQPTATADHVVQLAQMQLEQLLHPPAKKRKNKKNKFIKLNGQHIAIQEITVTVTSCVLLEHRQRKLFDENPRLDKQSLAHLINRLSGRLGRENVVYPTLVSGAQPEHAYQLKPLVNPYSRGPRRTSSNPTHRQSHTLARPFKLFKPPITLKTEAPVQRSIKPTVPSSIQIDSLKHKIINSWGPERIETGWWRGRTVRRDYWRIETASHLQFWIFHDLRQQKWFLQGEF